ncbi:MAG: hypothetical protein HFH04_05825 [Dorea sp.]|nr:hypothetical protein [Dorea sp.]
MSRWKEFMRGTAAVLAAVVLAGSGIGMPVRAAEPPKDEAGNDKDQNKEPGIVPQNNSNIEWKAANNKVPVFEYNKKNSLEIFIINRENVEIKNIKVDPCIDEEDISKWPFQKDNQDDAKKIDKLAAGATSQALKYTFKERDDIGTGNHKIYFECTYELADGTTLAEGDDGKRSSKKAFWVKTIAKPEEDKPLEVNITDKTPKDGEGTNEEIPTDDGGGIDNGDASYSGGGGGGDDGGGDGSVPRVIVTGFDTKPKEVKAGTDFSLTVHLKNTSKKTKVKNMLFDLNAPEEGSDEQTTAPAFLPSSGSSTVYLDGISANGTADITMKLNAKSDLLQKPYSVELSMKYEDSSGSAVEAASSLSVPVKQDARFEFSDFEINPESVAVGDEANVMCSLYNLGRTKLYNVKAIFEGNSIEREEIFVGNVESGATASIDAMLKGAQATAGPEPITMTMSYEDEEGEETSEKKELMLEVTESVDEGMETESPMEEESSGGFPIIPVVIVIGVIGMASAAIILIKERKKRMRKSEEEDFLYELDGSSEDEQ